MELGHMLHQGLEQLAIAQSLMGVKEALRLDHHLHLALVGEKDSQVQEKLIQG